MSYDQLSTTRSSSPYTDGHVMDTIATAWRDPARKGLELDMYETRAYTWMHGLHMLNVLPLDDKFTKNVP